MYTKMRKSLKSKGSSKHRNKPSASPPPSATSVPSSQPTAIAHMQTQVDSLNALVNSLSESLMARMDALTASLASSSTPQSSSQTLLGPDAAPPQPGQTAGESRTFQALGVASGTSGGGAQYFGQGVRAPQEFVVPRLLRSLTRLRLRLLSPQLSLSLRRLLRVRGILPPQPSTSGWAPSGPPPPPRSLRGSRSSSESEASETESEASVHDSASARLADLIDEVCLDSRPQSDVPRQPRCGFEGWFGQPESSTSRPHFRLYPGVGEVESEVAARVEALARRSKPLSQILPTRSRRHAVADRPLFASSLAVNPSFAQLAGAKSVGSKRWGSITFRRWSCWSDYSGLSWR